MIEHPLTDEIILSIADEAYHLPGYQDDMRATADWQLEQVIEWLQENLLLCNDKLEYCYLKKYPLSGMSIDKDKVIEDLKQVMRPTQQQQEDKS